MSAVLRDNRFNSSPSRISSVFNLEAASSAAFPFALMKKMVRHNNRISDLSSNFRSEMEREGVTCDEMLNSLDETKREIASEKNRL